MAGESGESNPHPGVAAGMAAFNYATDYFNTQAANNANKAAASRAQRFAYKMATTARLRDYNDLKNTGLNPILAAGGNGAGSPMGVLASTAKQDGAELDPLMFHNARRSNAQTESEKATKANIVTDTGLKAANTKAANMSVEVSKQTNKLLQAQTAKAGEDARMSRQQANLADKYGEASTVMGLINSGTGSIGNLLSLKNLLGGNAREKFLDKLKDKKTDSLLSIPKE